VYAARRTAFVYGTRLKTKWQKIGAVLPMIRKNKSVTIIMPKALKNFLDFQMQLEYLFGGNTVA
jgi:hypothetical protein